ncbi:MAG: hypothetical protein LBJ78_01625 [Puniceicoccales bacterium]|jgi:hypothetical protein|nr:hypothetical protein [Puniceicoccales bacterium]
MTLQKVYTFFTLFLLVPLIHADVDFPELAGKITEFANQLESIPGTDSSYQDTVNQLRTNAADLTFLSRRKKAIVLIENILQALRVDPNFEATQALRVDLDLEAILEALIANVHDVVAQLADRSLADLQMAAHNHFSNLYPGANIKFSLKKAGGQLGTTANVNGILYYIKTHRYGSSSSSGKKDPAKPVGPRELFVYRFLEYSGFGPEVHFFWLNERDFYIATKDVGYSASRTIHICPYETVKAELLTTASLHDPSKQVVIQGLFFLDAICQIFRLTDLLTNPGNFFFIADESDQIFDFKVVDFDLIGEGKSPTEEEPGTPKKGDGRGKSFAGYSPVKADILEEIPPDWKRRFFTPMIGSILPAIVYAFRDIFLLQKEIPSLDVDFLQRYVDSVAGNLFVFSKEVLSFDVKTNPIDVDSLKQYTRSVREFVTVRPTVVETTRIIDGINFRLRDVPPDGDCGIWAVLLATGRELNREAMVNLRRQAAEMMPPPEQPPTDEPTGDAYARAPNYDIRREHDILEMPGRFIGPEHLHFIGKILDVTIVIYDVTNKRFQNIDGKPILIGAAIENVRNGGILLYYDENRRHFQVMDLVE